MCGIAGCVTPPGREPDLAALQRMEASLAPRGPDDSGIERWRNVGLVNTRLAIVDPGPAGRQPMADHLDRCLLTYNGEVYNHRELRSELSVQSWRGHSDTETLVEALAAWGPAAIERCNGPIAFAALDKVGRRLVLARDRFGKKPIYLARHEGVLWFASEMRALLAAGVPARANREVLAHTATRGWAHGRGTPFEKIERLPPGTALTVDLRTLDVSERRWYEPADTVDPELSAELARLSRRDLVGRLDRALRRSVRRRLMADVPVGTMCSGGLDSSLITAIAHQAQSSVVAFNCSLPDEPQSDEAAWAERAARPVGVQLETVRITAAGWRAALVDAVRRQEYPLHNPASVPIALIAERARQSGVKVLLTGEAADELFGGYMNHRVALGEFLPTHLKLYRETERLLRRPRAYARKRLWGRGDAWRRDIGIEPTPESLRIERAVRESATRAYSHHSGPRARVEAELLGDLSRFGFPFLLNRMDKDAMARSVEVRLPFLDPEVLTLVLNLPLEARTRPHVKGILRDVGRRYLSRRVAMRTKFLGMNLNGRRRIEEAARPQFLEEGVLRELLGIPAERFRALSATATGRRGLQLWTAEIWARLFLEGQSVERVEADLWIPEKV